MAREGFAIALTVENPNNPVVKKTAGFRSWISINQNGESTILDVGKHEIMRRVDINARDLRILDPLLSYPSTILGREKVIVLNLEHIKAIITADEVLMRDPQDQFVIPVIEELRRRLPVEQVGSKGQGEDDEQQGGQNDAETDEEREFPFEFRALEVALEAICSFLDARTRELETDTYPALDELTSKISSRNLDRVRKLKSAMTRLTNRVQKVRDEIEQLLDDDEDMEDLYLSRKLAGPDSSPVSGSADPAFHNSPTLGSRISKMSRASAASINDEIDVEELEMLLEALFMQIDGTMNKLTTLREYIDDTEDYINIQLDNCGNASISDLHPHSTHKPWLMSCGGVTQYMRNQLIQLELFLGSGTLCLSVYSLVAAIFGMNIPYTWNKHHSHIFKWVVVLTGVLSGSILLTILAFARQKGLVGS